MIGSSSVRRLRARGLGPVELDVWGSRGSRSLLPPRSAIANYTSCYSVRSGEELFVLDGGLGLAALAHALRTTERFAGVRRVRVFVGHAHRDHWEGLKDADWFWHPGNGLRVTLVAGRETLTAIRTGHRHPAYVPLETLAAGTLARLATVELRAGTRRRVGPWTVRPLPLHHYSGAGRRRSFLDALGIRLSLPGGPAIGYLSDHEPTPATEGVEARLVGGSDLAIVDAHFPDRADHAYGHGSIEHAARLARLYPATLVLAAHHGPGLSDEAIRGAYERHGAGLANLELAVEGATYRWEPACGRFLAASSRREPTAPRRAYGASKP